MFATFRNLGALQEATLDLSKRLIVLTGPNNTGKTYLAWSLYGLFRRAYLRLPAGAALADALLAAPEHSVDVAEVTRAAQATAGELAEQFAGELARFFASPPELFAAASVELTRGSDEPPWSRGWSVDAAFSRDFSGTTASSGSTGSGMLKLTLAFSDDPIRPATAASGMTFSELPPLDREKVRQRLAYIVTQLLSEPRPIAIFPAERIAINVFAKELALKRVELVDQVLETTSDPRQLIEREARRYPVPIRDSIRIANDLAHLSNERGPFQDLAHELESILGGKLEFTDVGELAFTPEHGSGPRLGLHVSSSLVKSLASLVFYFRHLAVEDAMLVIDEPELNLHPSLQRLVARFLARVVRRGFQVVITTHSDYIIRELSNLVRLGQRGEEGMALAAHLGYDPEFLLPARDVGVWLVNDGRAEQLEVDDDGFTVPTIDEAIEAQNSDTATISFGPPEES